MLEQICALQKAYGKTPAELETLVEGFAWALADYPMQRIIKGFRKYVLTHNDIPAPADIIKIIDYELWEESFKNPDKSTLRQYKQRGIPLTPEQEAELSHE